MTLVKICGLSNADTLEAAIDYGADFIGLVFFEKSPRHVSIEQAAELAKIARNRTNIVALTVDADDDLIRQINLHVSPDYFQLHGSEDAARLKQIQELTGKKIIKAFKIRDQNDIDDALSFPESDFIALFDAKAPEDAPLPGGNGEAFDWTLLNQWPSDRPFMLAGGLNSHNVVQGILDTNAPMIDVSSGVEEEPGVKSSQKIKSLIKAVKPIKSRC